MNPPQQPLGEGILTEWLLRLFALMMYGLAISNLAVAWWADTGRWTLVLLLITEGYTLLMVLLARRASTRDLTGWTVVATGYAAFFFVLFEAKDTQHLIPEAAGVTLQVLGMAWQFASKIALGRSFGVLPARRTLVLGGPYRVVRHPIYLGYLIAHVGFLLANWSWRNAIVLGVLYVAQVYRIQREEAVLSGSPDYVDYQQRVRWRLIPGIY